MAATRGLSKEQQERARAAIQTTQLVKRLNMYALGQTDPAAKAKDGDDAKPVEIDANRLRAIDILLRKSLPDLSAITLAGDAENPIKMKVTIGGD